MHIYIYYLFTRELCLKVVLFPIPYAYTAPTMSDFLLQRVCRVLEGRYGCQVNASRMGSGATLKPRASRGVTQSDPLTPRRASPGLRYSGRPTHR